MKKNYDCASICENRSTCSIINSNWPNPFLSVLRPMVGGGGSSSTRTAELGSSVDFHELKFN